jgi:hypothetical protein
MSARLGRISDCFVSSKDAHGFSWDLIWTYKTHYTDTAISNQFRGGFQADNDEGKALARCEGHRRPHYDAMRKSSAAEVNRDWATTAILDTWAQTLDTLKNTQPPATARAVRIDFGGMFGIGERAFNNPVTGGAQPCPAGYTAYEFKGTFNVDWPASYCGRIGGVSEPEADFGGMYGSPNDNDSTGTYWIKNPVTGTASCPTVFQTAEVNNQQKLYYCWRKHTAGQISPYLFGGMFSDNGDKKNPIIHRMLCPVGYSPGLVHTERAPAPASPPRATWSFAGRRRAGRCAWLDAERGGDLNARDEVLQVNAPDRMRVHGWTKGVVTPRPHECADPEGPAGAIVDLYRALAEGGRPRTIIKPACRIERGNARSGGRAI